MAAMQGAENDRAADRPADRTVGWAAASAYGGAALALVLVQPPSALAGSTAAVVATGVLLGLVMALAHRNRTRPALGVPALVVLLAVAVVTDAGAVAMTRPGRRIPAASGSS